MYVLAAYVYMSDEVLTGLATTPVIFAHTAVPVGRIARKSSNASRSPKGLATRSACRPRTSFRTPLSGGRARRSSRLRIRVETPETGGDRDASLRSTDQRPSAALPYGADRKSSRRSRGSASARLPRGGAFTVVARDGRVVAHFHEVCGYTAKDLAVGPDERAAVFTMWSAPVENWLLYACEAGKARLLGERMGYHGNPSFSEDGSWVYFVHHPRKGGPIGMHEEGANAQLYRVHFDGSGVEALTDSKGCKLAPQKVGATVVYVHATCEGPRSIESLKLDGSRQVTTIEEGFDTHWPDFSPDGRRLLLTRRTLAGVQLLAMDVQQKTTRVLWGLPEGYEETRAGWGTNTSTIIYQRDGSVWRILLGKVPREEKLVNIGGVS